ncbi:MAG TPA: Glu-tRNA(Gln) amidotransferase subunit GatE [Methanolinea sp.]|jgi:glutamyl-tRNA(Gln) amidotransferase subunit E|nr:MAG: Glutamyl-tRNA(Gln) amidotransferase subunit E [Methanoregulaceae archaeon PtaB.Bin009]OPY37986.1 MAG: Glutamyl-tRNA(Gln) amidotransferase subunit E [Methanoregulaceae archaeon PtaU1.Bin066]HII77212.1 Glu-tRNA(Gln) amidotransferase subunit GatE [Methanolinea sp.]HNQ28984.1 Glu-tRNA(Gln) amidotransferase subunit GatE [Methanolinea sp.]
MDYNALGLVAGIEIHQQLNTREKLFCRCPTLLRPFEEHDGEFSRYLRATESELGEIDRAAREEMKNFRRFLYYTYDSTCLVENDEEPPAPLNPEALATCLQIAKMFGMAPIPQVHTMRKLVIDGSNTSGFQRTALVAVNGTLPNGGTIETICIEEEAAQRVKDEVFSLDRLGIPLVEITTSPCMHTPEEVQEIAEYLGMVLRSTGKVKRGLGTIRQDINISISGGARVEIKGVQELDLIAEVVRREVERQERLLSIRDRLKERGASVSGTPVDVTEIFSHTGSGILKKASRIMAVTLAGFAGLVGDEIQPARRLGSELSDYAKKCGVGGIFHTDELPAYGVNAEEVTALRDMVGAGESDCIVIVAGTPRQAGCACQQVIRRAELALLGVPEETRKMLEGGSTSYMRPLPGAARMYPETDVLPVTISPEYWEDIPRVELLQAKAERYMTAHGLDAAVAKQVAYSEHLPLYERSVGLGIPATLSARTLIATLKELSRDGLDIRPLVADCDAAGNAVMPAVLQVLKGVVEERVGKEAIPDVLRRIVQGESAETAMQAVEATVAGTDLDALARRIVSERMTFVSEKGMGALGPLMGVMMKEVGGAVDGKKVSQVLKAALDQALSGR